MKFVLVLSVVYLDYVFTTFLNDGIHYAETSSIKRLTEQVGSYEFKEGGCLVQDATLIPNNPVIVHKRHAKHRKHKKTKAIRQNRRQNKKKAKLLNKRIRNAVNKREKDTIKTTKARKKHLYMMTRSIPIILEPSKSASNIEPSAVKNITVASTKQTLKLVNATVNDLKTLVNESVKNVNELTNMSLHELKTMSRESTEKVKEALKSGDETGAMYMLDENKKYFENLNTAIVKKIEEYYALFEKQVKNYVAYSEDIVKNQSEYQRVLMKEVILKTPVEKKYLNSASRRINAFSRDSTDMINVMIPETLRLIEDVIKRNAELFKKISEQGYKMGENTIAAHKEDEDKEEEEDPLLAKMLKEFEENSKKAYKHCLAKLEKIAPKLMKKGNVLISSLENKKVK